MKLSNLALCLVVMVSFAACESTTKVKNPNHITNEVTSAVSKKEEVVVVAPPAVTVPEVKVPEPTPVVVPKEISALELCQSAFTEESSEILSSKKEKDNFIRDMNRFFFSKEKLEVKDCDMLTKKINEKKSFSFWDIRLTQDTPVKWAENIIKELKNAEALSLKNVIIKDLNVVLKMTNLRDLSLEKMDVKDLKGLEQFKNLSILRLDNVNLQNESLDYLPKTTNRVMGAYSLYLDNNKGLTDISKLVDYSNAISILSLNENNNIKDFKPISQMKKLFALKLENAAITDADLHVMELEKLDKLNVLVLSGNKQISNLDFLSELKSLTSLDLKNMNSDLDLKSVTKAEKLEELIISKDQYTVELADYLGLAGITVVAM